MFFLKTAKYYFLKILDVVFSWWLLLIRKDDYFLTEDNYQHIKNCAKQAYPNEVLDYNNCPTMSDLLTLMGCSKGKIYVLTGDTWYFILIREITHIVAYDFASATGKCTEIFRIYNILINLFRNKRCFIMARETTSYPLIKKFERRGDYKILNDELTFRDGENYHKMYLKVNRKSSKGKVR